VGRITTATLSRHRAPDFVMLGGLELLQLRKLGWLARALFIELLAMADHSTGRISTSYAVLAALLDFDQAPTAHQAAAPTLQRLRTALDELVALRLVHVDRIANEKRKGLFLKVQTRAGISAPGEKSNRQSNRPARPKKQATTTTCAPTARDEQQTEQQGVQEEYFPPSPPLSTAPPPEARARLAAISRSIAARGTPEASPLRGDVRRPFGARPPGGWRPPESAQADSSPPGVHLASTAAGVGLLNTALEGGKLPKADRATAPSTGQDAPGGPQSAEQAPVDALA